SRKGRHTVAIVQLRRSRMFMATRRSHDPSSGGTKYDLLDKFRSYGACSVILRPSGYKYFVPAGLINWLYTKSLKLFEVVLHGFQHFRRVPLPISDLAHNPQRLKGAE